MLKHSINYVINNTVIGIEVPNVLLFKSIIWDQELICKRINANFSFSIN
jgi:hypothetical protein